MGKTSKELNHNQKMFIKDYVKAINNNNAAIFAGAGLSIPSGMLSWKELLQEFAQELELVDDSMTDMATLAQYYQNYKGSRKEISEQVMNSFPEHTEPNDNQKIIAELPIDTVWTTNYDTLLEKAYTNEFKKFLAKRSPKDFSLNAKKNDVVIYKMHGDINQPAEAIITKDDYETYEDTHLVYTTALKGDLVEKKFLFIGFSFEDPNLDYTLARIRALIGKNKPNHYFFIEEPKKGDDESDNSFKLRCTRQELKIQDLKRYGINAVLLNSYDDITFILSEIKRLTNLNSIFISGASEKLTDQSKNLIDQLSKKLICEDNKIISGFGLGVGSEVINAVINKVSENPWLKLDDHLKLYPFPQNKETNWHDYRQTILEYAGIAIFLFGTKYNSDHQIVNSKGMLDEFEIAHSKGIKIIPVGCTGGASKEISSLVLQNPEEYYDNQTVIEEVKKLHEHSLESADDVDCVVDLICSLVKELQVIK